MTDLHQSLGLYLVEAAGVEPASRNLFPSVLHAYPDDLSLSSGFADRRANRCPAPLISGPRRRQPRALGFVI